MAYVFQLFLFAVFIVVAYSIGTLIETEHYNNIKDRETLFLDLPAVTSKNIEKQDNIESAELVYGSVVISLDYFKRFLAAMRNIFGGRIVSYETLLDRGRREAILRMKELARKKGYDAVLNMRFETSSIGRVNTGNSSVGCFEVLAYGTAVRYV